MKTTCVKDIGMYMLNPYNLGKLGTLYTCLGKEAIALKQFTSIRGF
jgi:hypothetical protein